MDIAGLPGTPTTRPCARTAVQQLHNPAAAARLMARHTQRMQKPRYTTPQCQAVGGCCAGPLFGRPPYNAPRRRPPVYLQHSDNNTEDRNVAAQGTKNPATPLFHSKRPQSGVAAATPVYTRPVVHCIMQALFCTWRHLLHSTHFMLVTTSHPAACIPGCCPNAYAHSSPVQQKRRSRATSCLWCACPHSVPAPVPANTEQLAPTSHT
jgi:hypothetical protein